MYRYSFNGKENESTTGQGAYDFGARIYDGRLGRWWSVDPMTTKYAGFSPFIGLGNSPIYYIDKDGQENIVYLIYVSPKSNSKSALKSGEIEAIKREIEVQMSNMMTRTKVVVYTGKEPFDPRNMDKTDTFILIGDAKDCADYFKINKLDQKIAKTNDGKDAHSINVETDHIVNNTDVLETTSSGDGDPSRNPGGAGGIIAIDRIRSWALEANLSFTQAITLTVLHVVYGHNTNYVNGYHLSSRDVPIAFDACRLSIMLNPEKVCITDSGLKDKNDYEQQSYSNIIEGSSGNIEFMKFVQKRFGIKPAKDNYDKNKSSRKN